ncbi:MAG: hydroxyacid dehydrogenase, partial [Chromatiales bacterium]|nr:hydroxyacid dehydrogenase [Chromatiales bacterium]
MDKYLLVTSEMSERDRAVVERTVAGRASIQYLTDVATEDRAAGLRQASVLVSRNTATELEEDELPLLEEVSLLQFISAGIDFVPLGAMPPKLTVACNGGGYAEPMAEHCMAMVLAAAKRLSIEHANLKAGEFNQFVPNRLLRGGTALIVGFGGIGIACARLLRAFGMNIFATNRSATSEEPTDWLSTNDDLLPMLEQADVIVLSAPLTPTTEGLIGSRELSVAKDEAILVNLARGEIVHELALYDHLVAHPQFIACIDAWWIEPVRHGEFRMR